MARTAKHDQAEGRVVKTDVTAEMEGSFLEYAYSVIYARALPDARDGLKPVQRRILFQMADMGLRPDRGFVKSARVVGEVMGKLHPHGDAAIYDAMVRLAQPFSLRLPLVDGHGNFGSPDDGPAAPRYTEARLAPAAMAMTESLDEGVVDFVPNYDNKLTQPEVLPAAIPNLLVNGATGIAVGMATNMAPHNLVEVIAAARFLLKHPKATLEQIMEFIPGPDLPTGGIIVGLDGVREAYSTGRGVFRVRAKASVEDVSGRKKGIVVTELPYGVGPERVIEKIKDAVNSKKLTGIANVVDLTDRANGLRIVVEVKTGFNPQAVLEQLYKHTPMEESFGINNVALVDGQPRTLGLLDLLHVWVNHRLEVTRRRCEHRLGRKKDRLHLVEGLLKAILDIDKVIGIIRRADDAEVARERLCKQFKLTVTQADYILELRLRRLTKFSRVELEAEHKELVKQIAELEGVLGSDRKLRNLVSGEMRHVADTYGTSRVTVLLDEVPEPQASVAASLEIADEPTWVMLSATGRVGRTADGAEPVRSDTAKRARHDLITHTVAVTARGKVGLVTSAGRMVRVDVLDVPVVPGASLASGAPVGELVALDKGETVVGAVPLGGKAAPLAVATRCGVIKRVVSGDEPVNSDAWMVITLKDGDEVVGAHLAGDGDTLVLVTSDASLLKFASSSVRPQGRSSGGMAGIRLADGQRVVGFGVVPSGEDGWVATVAAGADANATSVKVTALSAFPTKGRATGGVRSHRFLKGEDRLVMACAGPHAPRAATRTGAPVQLPAPDPRRDASGSPLETAIHLIG